MAIATYPITTLKLPKEPPMAEEIVQLFVSHGCTLEATETHIKLTLPDGTMRREILPRLQIAQFWLCFPDGWKIREEWNWNEESLLLIPVSRVREE